MRLIETERKHYKLCFDDAQVPGSGYSFPCDADGNIFWYECKYPDAAKKSLTFCLVHPEKWTEESRCGRIEEIIDRGWYGVCPYCGYEFFLSEHDCIDAFECKCCHWYIEIKPPKEGKYETV